MTGAHVLDETWKDALGGMFQCTVAGTPGTWKQILPAAVTLANTDGEIGELTVSDPPSSIFSMNIGLKRTTTSQCACTENKG